MNSARQGKCSVRTDELGALDEVNIERAGGRMSRNDVRIVDEGPRTSSRRCEHARSKLREPGRIVLTSMGKVRGHRRAM